MIGKAQDPFRFENNGSRNKESIPVEKSQGLLEFNFIVAGEQSGEDIRINPCHKNIVRMR